MYLSIHLALFNFPSLKLIDHWGTVNSLHLRCPGNVQSAQFPRVSPHIMRPDPSESGSDLPHSALPDPGASDDPDPNRGHGDTDHETRDPGCRGRGVCCLVLVTAPLSVLLSLTLILPSLYTILRSVDVSGHSAANNTYDRQTQDTARYQQKMHQVVKRK